VIGANADQNAVAPGVVLGSAVIDLPRAFLTVARAVHERAPLPPVFALGAETGVVRFVINPSLGHHVSLQARHRIDSVWSTMTSGNWRSPVSWARSAESKP
jgi:basic membrane protein A